MNGQRSTPRPPMPHSSRRGTVLIVIVVIMAILAMVVAGSIRPVRDEADLATLRVETTRAFYSSESGAFIVVSAIKGDSPMPAQGSSIVLGSQTISFIRLPDEDPTAVLEGISGDATRRIELTSE